MSVLAGPTNLAAFPAIDAPDTASDTTNDTTTLVRAAHTVSTTSIADPHKDWLTLRLPRDEAIAYLRFEILEWFREQGIDIEAVRRNAKDVRTLAVCQD